MAKLIEVKRVGWRPAGSSSGYNQFRAVFEGKPEPGQVADAQDQAGYHPAGYGGPYRTGETENEDGTYTVMFECSNSCD